MDRLSAALLASGKGAVGAGDVTTTGPAGTEVDVHRTGHPFGDCSPGAQSEAGRGRGREASEQDFSQSITANAAVSIISVSLAMG